MAFYESLRTALSRYEAGVHSACPPATISELEKAEQVLGPLPPSYRSFLTSFNGVTLFHESVHLYSIPWADSAAPHPGYLRIGEIPEGTLWMKNNGKIYCVDESEPDPLLIATEIEELIDAVIAREGLLIDHQGEFLEVFDDDGNVLPAIRKKQAKAGQKRAPHSAFFLYEQAEFAWMDRNETMAISLLQSAISFDETAAPCYELLAALYEQKECFQDATHALGKAAECSITPSLAAARFVKAGLLAEKGECPTYAKAAWNADPNYAQRLCVQIESSLNLPREELSILLKPLVFLAENAPISLDTENIQKKCSLFQEKLRLRSTLQVL